MRLRGIGWFWATSAVLSVVAVCLVPGRVWADWTYDYQENFSTDRAETDSHFHSIFWPHGAYPPSEPYLYYLENGFQRELGFGDHQGVEASLSFRFPVGSNPPHRAVNGSLRVSVRKHSSISASGYLLYTTSPDGINWETERELFPGTHDIWMESVRGTCYIKFKGTGVLIDDLSVDLSEYPATIHVPGDYSTIQNAIIFARDGDVVEVAPGTYTDDGNWDIDFRGRAITVRSAEGPTRTIIDCQGSHRGFYFQDRERSDSVLRGFTIRDGLVTGSEIPSDNANWNPGPTHPVGGGIYCEFSDPTIIDCIIKRCTAEVGGGIGCVGASPTIIDCEIRQCNAGGQGTAGSGGFGAGIGLIRDSNAEIIKCRIEDNRGYSNSLGGGLYCWKSQVRMEGCTIASNSASANIKGGGLYGGGSSSDISLKNCIIYRNTAELGGGIFIDSGPGNVTVVNCTIANNNLSGSPSSSKGGGIHSLISNFSVSNSIVWYNDDDGRAIYPSTSNSVHYSDIEGGYTGQRNIDADPLFASAGGDDYHLQSHIDFGRYDPGRNQWVTDYYSSPCIDAGDPQDPVGAEPLTNGNCINMGTFGGTAEASKGEGAWVYHVDGTNGSDSNGGLSPSDAYATIQKAVDEACEGDIIMVWPGIYREEVECKLRSVTIQSADDAAVVRAPTGYAFSFFTAESSNCIVRNFVITGCGDAGIYCSSSSPVLANLTITDNVYGIRAEGGANPDIVNCILWDNDNGDLHRCRASYSCVEWEEQAATPDNSNFSEDPRFAFPSSGADGDYHLMSKNGRYVPGNSPGTGTWVTDQLASPCIDTGDPSMKLGREQRDHGGRINVGAYGGTPYASKSRN
ncbi:right-handed parallel beta-helix repeat-containing protein [Planctomycetota bacterium]